MMVREVWEMAEETSNDENEFTCTKGKCRFKIMSSLKYHYNTNYTPTGQNFLKPVEIFFSLN